MGYAVYGVIDASGTFSETKRITTTDLSIKEISEPLGFSDQFYFSRAFSKMHGHAPSEHRARYRI